MRRTGLWAILHTAAYTPHDWLRTEYRCEDGEAMPTLTPRCSLGMRGNAMRDAPKRTPTSIFMSPRRKSSRSCGHRIGIGLHHYAWA